MLCVNSAKDSEDRSLRHTLYDYISVQGPQSQVLFEKLFPLGFNHMLSLKPPYIIEKYD